MLGIFWTEQFVYKIPWNFKNSFDNIKSWLYRRIKKKKKLLERNVVVHFFIHTKKKNETIKCKLENGRVNRTIASHETEEKKNEYRINSQIKRICCTRSTARYSFALPCSFAGWFLFFVFFKWCQQSASMRNNGWIFSRSFFFPSVLRHSVIEIINLNHFRRHSIFAYESFAYLFARHLTL